MQKILITHLFLNSVRPSQFLHHRQHVKSFSMPAQRRTPMWSGVAQQSPLMRIYKFYRKGLNCNNTLFSSYILLFLYWAAALIPISSTTPSLHITHKLTPYSLKKTKRQEKSYSDVVKILHQTRNDLYRIHCPSVFMYEFINASM